MARAMFRFSCLLAACSAFISPGAMVTLQKAINREKFTATVEGYAKVNKLSLADAELAYAAYLLDPDGFVLEKARSKSRRTRVETAGAQAAESKLGSPKAAGKGKPNPKPLKALKAQPGQRRSPLLQAYIDEGGDEVRLRIEKFERENTVKALCVVAFFSAALIFGKDYLGA
ncbi:hypothetical protein M885DRAFT_616305 [Pelagophyceae sp. CCMP2097]|nr:hypothetical protein M885DRAFT_616305 [Pelagophyceae sp. CCMP2097]